MTVNPAHPEQPFQSSYLKILVALKKALTGADQLTSANAVIRSSIMDDSNLKHLQDLVDEVKEGLDSITHNIENVLSRLETINPRDAENYKRSAAELFTKKKEIDAVVETLSTKLRTTREETLEKNSEILGEINRAPDTDAATKSAPIQRKLVTLHDTTAPLTTKTTNTLLTAADTLRGLTALYTNAWDRLPPNVKEIVPKPNAIASPVMRKVVITTQPTLNKRDAVEPSATTPKLGSG